MIYTEDCDPESQTRSRHGHRIQHGAGSKVEIAAQDAAEAAIMSVAAVVFRPGGSSRLLAIDMNEGRGGSRLRRGKSEQQRIQGQRQGRKERRKRLSCMGGSWTHGAGL
jgi:hypothetical protein